MADAILTPSAGTVPPLDTVLLWVTTTVERDYEARGAFPGLRHAHAKAFRGAASLHYLSADKAEEVLADATVREQSVRRGTRNAYAAHIKSIQAAIKEAVERPSVLASPQPVSTYRSEHAERWCGTKGQLRAHGIQLDGPWPHEPGGNERWAQAKDSRGYKTSITRFSAIWPAIWPGLYEAHISIPYEVWGAKHSSKPKADEADLAKRNLASMPKSADDFRAHLVDSMRMMARINIEQAMKAATWHGYTLDEDSVDEIHASFDAVVEAVVGAKVNFDAALHAQIAQKYRAQMAGADTAFQAQFQSLVRTNLGILEGGAQ